MPPRPPRKSGPSGVVVACGVAGAVAFVAVAVVIVGALLARAGDGPDDGPPIAISSPSPGSVQTPSPTGPPDPQPGAPQMPRRALEENGLYVPAEVPAVACPIDQPELRDAAEMEGFLNGLESCLRQLWTGEFQAAGMPWQPATVNIWETQGRGPCGDFKQPGVAAYYCPINSTIYMGSTHIVETAGPFGQFPSVYIRLFAHEYGHHIQGASGIIEAEDELYSRNPTPANQREIIRRGELQADCFAGLFIHAISGSYPLSDVARRAMYADIRGRGDDGRPIEKRDHGRGATRQRWLSAGYDSGIPQRCNTWSASDQRTT